MNLKNSIMIFLLLCAFSVCAQEVVYADKKGILRSIADKKEVAFFGANYCLPSACDFRATTMVGGDKKGMIDNDLTHFTRMGFDAIRLSFWGDWENCDIKGNLIDNEHLDLLDYLIYTASQRGIKMLFSPIVTYNANWPDRTNVQDMPGFSAHIDKWKLITDTSAIQAQVNYMTQILNHKNRTLE